MTGIINGRTNVWLGVALLLMLGVADAARGDAVRLVNGAGVEGEVLEVQEDGLRMRTPRGEITFAWETLSPATRFRYQPRFRANYEAILEGLPPNARTNRPLEELLEELE